MVRTLTGCVKNLWEGLSTPSFNVITNNTIVAFESSIFEGVDTFIRYIVNEFFRRIMDDRQYRAKKKIHKRSYE